MYLFSSIIRKVWLLIAACAICFAASASAQIDPTSPAQIKWSLIVNAGAPTAPCPTTSVPQGTPYFDSTAGKRYTCGPSGWVGDSASGGNGLPSCPDTSGSGTVQSCSTSPTFTPAANQSCILYSTTTANSGTGLTVNVNSLGAKPVAIAGASGWTTTLSTSPASIPSGKPLAMCYDGTNWDALQTGTGTSGSGVSGQAANVVPLGTSPTAISNQSHIDEATAGQTTVNQTLAVNDASHPSRALVFPNANVCAAVAGAFGYCPSDSLSSGSILQGPDAPGSGDQLWYLSSAGGVMKMKPLSLGGSLSLSGGTLSDSVGTGAVSNITGSSQITASGCTQSSSTQGKCTVSGTSTNTVTLSAIPGSYSSIRFVITGASTTGWNTLRVKFNGDSTAANYATAGWYSDAGGGITQSWTVPTTTAGCIGGILYSTGVGTSVVEIEDYSNTSFVKFIHERQGNLATFSTNSNSEQASFNCGWNSTSAITSITITTPNFFANGTIIRIYGVS